MWRIAAVCCVLLVSTLRAEHSVADFDFYDINEVFDAFQVDCGSVDDKHMTIIYGGNAMAVYSASEPVKCAAEEVAPAVWQIRIDDYNNTDCPINQDDPKLVLLDVVVQMNKVRTVTDKLRSITCNYGLSGQESTNATNTAIGNRVDAQPEWVAANDNNASAIVTMNVYGTDGQPITQAVLGSYIQLRAFLSLGADGEEYSLRMYNCRAYDSKMSYYLMLSGCGVGTVLGKNRGFRTQSAALDAGPGSEGAWRVARSSYFKAFLMPTDDATLEFECDYLICDKNSTAECDGYSCPEALRTAERTYTRRKRRAVDNMAVQAVYETGLPKVHTTKLHIAPPAEEQARFAVGSEVLITDQKPVAAAANPWQKSDKRQELPAIWLEEEEGAAKRVSSGLFLGLDTLTLTLLVVFVVLTTVVVVLVSMLCCCRRHNAAYDEKSGLEFAQPHMCAGKF